MTWRMDSTAGAAIWDTEPLGAEDLLCRNEELVWRATQDGRSQWKLINGRIADSGHPTANLGAYTSFGAYPPQAAQTSTAVTTATPGTGIWTSTIYSPILGNGLLAGQTFHCQASGTIQSSTSGLTVTTLPVIGSVTVNTATGGTPVTLGVSGTCALGSTLTSIWKLDFDVTIRTVGPTGTAYGIGNMFVGQTAAPVTGGANVLPVLLGGTSATVDFTGATSNLPGGFGIGQWGAATVTVVTNQVTWISW